MPTSIPNEALQQENPLTQRLDPTHRGMNFFGEPISADVWRDKYKWKDDNDILDMCWRVAEAINRQDGEDHIAAAFQAMAAGLWIPAGRILAGAGTGKRVTLVNCFVNMEMEDSMDSICQAQTNTTLTMQQGGGMGTDFSPLRPENAVLERTHSKASGPLPFMDGWNAWSKTIRSAGDRRGAMMGTLCDTHPDLPKFIVAKQQQGRLQEFNISVLVSDALMEAIAEDAEWLLHFPVPPSSRDQKLAEHDFVDDSNTKQYVYSVWRAKELWELITKNTYEWSEPGVIFIDRVNASNNLQHVEDIRCTNPCGEQPLPPHGACNLGHINLARLVHKPFTKSSSFDWELLKEIAKIGQRFLDNVIDITGYPLQEQYQEQQQKRRTGLGITGLADAMMQLQLRYGSPQATDFAEKVMQTVCMASYEQNVELAKEKGPCPAMDPDELSNEGYWQTEAFVVTRLPSTLQKEIRQHGLRNGVALTVAPTGTISTVFGYLDGSGCECAFAHQLDRKVRQPNEDGSNEDVYKTYKGVKGYTHRLYEALYPHKVETEERTDSWPSYFVTSQDLTVEEHIAVQAVIQRWVDASVSKTVNCPKEMTYAEFQRVYELAYSLGCKGCTTYRPSDVRGSILSVAGEESHQPKTAPDQGKIARPEVLSGRTYKIKWPKRAAALYMTINEDEEGYAREILCASKDSTSFEWVTALTLMLTAIFKKGGDIKFVAEELKQVQSVGDGCFFQATWEDKPKFYGSLVSYIGHLLEHHFNNGYSVAPQSVRSLAIGMMAGEQCPSCKQPSVVFQEGCKKCSNCTWSSC